MLEWNQLTDCRRSPISHSKSLTNTTSSFCYPAEQQVHRYHHTEIVCCPPPITFHDKNQKVDKQVPMTAINKYKQHTPTLSSSNLIHWFLTSYHLASSYHAIFITFFTLFFPRSLLSLLVFSDFNCALGPFVVALPSCILGLRDFPEIVLTNGSSSFHKRPN